MEYEVDCIIYASGFEITTEISRRYSIEAIEGRDGLSLFDYWQDGFKSLHGMTSRGFPNQFYTGFTQVGISANIAAIYEHQGEHIAYVIAEALARGATTVEPSQQAQDEWGATIRETAIDNSEFDVPARQAITTMKAAAAEKESARTSASPTGPASTRSRTYCGCGATRVSWKAWSGDLSGNRSQT